MLKKRLKLQESKDNISMNSTSSATIAGSLASALSVGMVTVADPKTSSSELRYVGWCRLGFYNKESFPLRAF